MNASITRIMEYCCRETGNAFDLRQRRIVCPFHGGKNRTCHIDETKGAWHCFSGGCSSPKGGILDVPIAFGLTTDRKSSAAWLSERNLIPAPDRSLRNEPYSYERNHSTYLVLSDIPEDCREVWRTAQINLREEIGGYYFSMFRKFSSEQRYAHNKIIEAEQIKRRETIAEISRLLAALIECERRGGDPWGPSAEDYAQAEIRSVEYESRAA